MKKATAVILTVLILLGCIPSVAESADAKLLRRNRLRIRWSMSMTAEMAGCALEQTENAGNERQRALLTRFSRVDYLSPDKAVVLEFSKAGMDKARKALNMSTGWSDISIALAGAINAQFSEDYTQAALLAQAEGKTTQEVSTYYALVLLPYGEDLAVISLTASGSVSSRAAFIISTPEISRNLGQEEIDGYLASFGLETPTVCVYEKRELEAMMAQEAWSSGSASANRLTDAVLASPRRRAALLPALMRSGSPFVDRSVKLGVLNTMLARMETADMAAVREAAGVWLPLLTEGAEDPAEVFLRIQDTAYGGNAAPPSVPWGADLQAAELKPDGTFLVVFETSVPDMDLNAWVDLRMEAVLPPERIPASAEEADYIILCRTDYSGSTGNGSARLHFPRTRITLHDARTGALLRELGTVKRRLTGAIMLPKGDTWWDPLRTELWKNISVLFAEE